MGIFDKIKNKYQELDEKAGGYLPGGIKPAEVKAANAAPVQAPINLPLVSKESVAGKSATETLGLIDKAAQPQSQQTTLPLASPESVKDKSTEKSINMIDEAAAEPEPITEPQTISDLGEVTPISNVSDGGYNGDGTYNDKPIENYVFSKSGNPEPEFGTSPLGSPLRSKEDVDISNQTQQIRYDFQKYTTFGQNIMNGNYNIADTSKAAEGYSDETHTVEQKQQLDAIRLWLENNAGGVEIASGNFGDIVAGAAAAGTTGAVAGGIAGSVAPAIGTAIGAAGGFVIGAGGYIGYYYSNVDSKEEYKDIREMFTAIDASMQAARKAGLNAEANALYAEAQEIFKMMETVGEYGKQYQLTGLVNDASEINIMFKQLENVSKSIIEDYANQVKATEAKINIGGEATREELEFAAKQGSTIAQSRLAIMNIVEEEADTAPIRNALVDRMMSMSYDDMKKDIGILNSLDDPTIKLIYEEAKRQALLEESRRYAEGQKADAADAAQDRLDEQRDYNEEQQALRDEQAFKDESLETEPTGSSTLNFGILSSSGDIEFVDRDAASNVYFGKTFDELTPAQKKLLALSKGKN